MQNVMALYGVQVGRKLIPLLSIPYMARILGPAGWGRVAFFTALADFLVILIEFGFNISATRQIARKRDQPLELAETMAGVMGAQFILASAGIAITLTAAYFVPILHNHPALLASGLLYAVAQGFSPQWFFQGLEKMRSAAALELSGKMAALIGLFFFVHGPDDGWKVLAMGALAPGFATIAALILAYRHMPFRVPTPRTVLPALKMGWPMFFFRSAESLYGVGNAFLLGLFTTAELVGYFSAAEKIAKAAFGLLNPIREAIFPRLSHLAATGGTEAASPLARRAALWMIGGGFALAAALYLCAPQATALLLGPSFAPAVKVLRIFSLLPVLLSITYSIGFQWLLPFGHDNAINQIILAAGVLNVGLSLLLAPGFADIGMAWAVITAEAFVSIAMVAAVRRMSVTQSSATPLEVTHG